MTSSPSTGSGADHLPSLWLHHKDVLHRLYITENKTLGQVKCTMESIHDFPVLRLHDYEIALREVLKLKKNLKKEDWYTIGVHISNRKRQGKQSEVRWNNRPMAERKVRKEVLRNRKISGLYGRKRTIELPVGIIISTPLGSPAGEEQLIMRPPAGPQENVSSVLYLGVPNVRQADSSTWGLQIACLETNQVAASRFRHMREDIPFNRFLSGLLSLAKSHSLIINVPIESTWTPGPRLFGRNPSFDVLAHFTFRLSNKLWIDWSSADNSWFLKWLGVSADFTMLKAFFSVKSPTACALYERLCEETRNLKRPAPARVLFEIQDTMIKTNAIVSAEAGFLRTAVQIGSRADGMREVAERALGRFSPRFDTASRRRSQHLQSLFMVAAAQRDIPMLRLLVGAVNYSESKTEFRGDAATRLLALVLRQLYAWDPEQPEDNDILVNYIGLLIQGGILSICLSTPCNRDDRPRLPIKNCESFTVDELVMLCPPPKRARLYSAVLQWSHDHNTFITKAGIFTAARKGTHNLSLYLQSYRQNHNFDIHAIMQECLLFASSLNDTETALALLGVGTDPEAGLLWNNYERYHKGVLSWDPIIVAAEAGNMETLMLLKEKVNLFSFVKRAPVYEIVQLEDMQNKYWNSTGNELQRLQNLHRHCQYSKTRVLDAAVANGTAYLQPFGYREGLRWPPEAAGEEAEGAFFAVSKRRIEVLEWIRDIATTLGIDKSIDKEIIEAALFNDQDINALQRRDTTYHPCDVLLLEGLVDANLDYHKNDMDLLQLSIRAQCRLEVVEFLLSKGLRVHSRAAAQSGNTMLHDALLGESRDRSQIVHLLLREGADYKQCGQGLTMLEASLQVTAPSDLLDYLDLFIHLFDAGAPVQQPPRPQLPEWTNLMSALVDARAEDELILEVLDAGAELNTRGTSPHTPLERAIWNKRENLAQELIRRGADIHAPARGSFCHTALQTACRANCSMHFIDSLVREHGASVNEAPCPIEGNTSLHGAAMRGSLSVAEFLLAHGADVNALSGEISDGFSFPRRRALDFAAETGRLDMTEFLLKAGGRSATAGLRGAIEISKKRRHFAVYSVLLDWEREHGSKIIMEEAEWQQQNPDSARVLLESLSDDDL